MCEVAPLHLFLHNLVDIAARTLCNVRPRHIDVDLLSHLRKSLTTEAFAPRLGKGLDGKIYEALRKRRRRTYLSKCE